MGDGLAAMMDYKNRSKIKNGAPTYEVAMEPGGDIIVGEFVDREREDYLSRMRRQLGSHYCEFPEQVEDQEPEGCCSEC